MPDLRFGGIPPPIKPLGARGELHYVGNRTLRTKDSSYPRLFGTGLVGPNYPDISARDTWSTVIITILFCTFEAKTNTLKTRFSKAKRLQCTQLGTSLTDVIWKRDVNYKTGSINTAQRRQNRTKPRPQFKHQKFGELRSLVFEICCRRDGQTDTPIAILCTIGAVVNIEGEVWCIQLPS